MKKRRITNVISVSIHHSYTLILENTLSLFIKISDPINVTFVKKGLVLHQNWKGMYKRFMKTRRNTNVMCEYSTLQHRSLRSLIECVHEKLKQHQCNICQKSFGLASKLKRHVQMNHENKKNYKCDLCEYSAFEQRGLRTHIECVHENLNIALYIFF